MKERFKIYGLLSPSVPEQERAILITDSAAPHEFTTFDEQFSLEANNQSSLSFSVVFESDGKKNPFQHLLQLESVIILELVDRIPDIPISDENSIFKGQVFKYKIKSRTPNITSNALSYSFSCDDYAADVYSKEGQGLAIDKTGTLRELAEEILSVTRKNVLYEDLNINLSKEERFYNSNFHFSSDLTYTTYSGDNIDRFDITRPISSRYFRYFSVTSDMKVGEKYDLTFDVLNSSFLPASGPETPIQMDLSLAQFSYLGILPDSTITTPQTVYEVGVPKHITLTFELKPATTIIYLYPTIVSNHSGEGEYRITLANIRLTKNKDFLEAHYVQSENDKPLRLIGISDLESEQTVYDPIRGFSQARMTFTIENSNLYNALVELATLFETEVRFDYIQNGFYFVSTKKIKYRGYRLNPNINLSSFDRPENSDEFASILHVRGNDDVNSVLPAIPKEWRAAFVKMVANQFVGEENFETYWNGEEGITYSQYAERYILGSLEANYDYYERKTEIMKFATQMDKIPNFDGTIYDFRYFRESGIITESLYSKLMTLLYDDLRKTNITINVLTYNYYTIFSQYSAQQNQIIYYINGIHNEQRFQYQGRQRLASPDAPRAYTQAWVGLMNQLDASESQEQDFIDQLEQVLGLGRYFSLEEGSFIYNVINLFGYGVAGIYASAQPLGIIKMLEENQTITENRRLELEEIENKIATIEAVLNDVNTDSFTREAYQVEYAGLLKQRDSYTTYLGLYSEGNDTYEYKGTLLLENEFLSRVRSIAGGLDIEATGLYTLLFDQANKENLVRIKEKLLEDLYYTYEAFAIEGVYENNDEIDSYGLLEQALNAFVYFSKPTVEYSIGTMDLSAIEDFESMPRPKIGEKILITEPGFYKSYHTDEETEYLVVTGISESLRDAGSVSLDVTQDDETERLVKGMLESLNMVKIEPYKQRSNLKLPVPQELAISAAELAGAFISNASDDTILKGFANTLNLFAGMFIKSPTISSTDTARFKY